MARERRGQGARDRRADKRMAKQSSQSSQSSDTVSYARSNAQLAEIKRAALEKGKAARKVSGDALRASRLKARAESNNKRTSERNTRTKESTKSRVALTTTNTKARKHYSNKETVSLASRKASDTDTIADQVGKKGLLKSITSRSKISDMKRKHESKRTNNKLIKKTKQG